MNRPATETDDELEQQLARLSTEHALTYRGDPQDAQMALLRSAARIGAEFERKRRKETT